MSEDVRTVRDCNPISSPHRTIRWATRSAVAAVTCLVVALACGAMQLGGQDGVVDHDIELRNHKIVLKDGKGTVRIQIAIEENGRAGIHFYSPGGLKRMFVGCTAEDVPMVVYFDQTGMMPVRRLGPAGPSS